jgi:signal transduction histidine kinase
MYWAIYYNNVLENDLGNRLDNLIANALKFTNNGFVEFGYEIVDSEGIKILQFFVRDTGIGIAKDRQDAIFERFIQADIADKHAYQGAGLGLASSKAYVEMLGGKMWVESEEGKGSVFYFTLPYVVPDKADLISSENII